MSTIDIVHGGKQNDLIEYVIPIVLSEGAVMPKRASAGAAGYDLCACIEKDIIIEPGHRALIPTGVHIQIPLGYYGRIAPRSGLAFKNGIDVLAGVIDSDYRGNIGVILLNTDLKTPFVVKSGDRIAQMIFEPHSTPKLEEVKKIDDTERGAGGYGSTGK